MTRQDNVKKTINTFELIWNSLTKIMQFYHVNDGLLFTEIMKSTMDVAKMENPQKYERGTMNSKSSLVFGNKTAAAAKSLTPSINFQV